MLELGGSDTNNALIAGPLGLLEEDPHGSSVNVMLQGLTRFLLDRVVQDFKTMSPPSPSAMEQVCELNLLYRTPLIFQQLLATAATSSIKCMNCRSEYTRPASTFVNDLLYPQMVG